MACQLCAGVTGIEALKILLDRGNIKAAPWFHQFDAYTGRFVSRRLHGGSRHVGQRLKQKLGLRMMQAIARNAPKPQPAPPAAEPMSEIWRILDLARWAPSGDNSQPWRFRIDGDDAVTICSTMRPGRTSTSTTTASRPCCPPAICWKPCASPPAATAAGWNGAISGASRAKAR